MAERWQQWMPFHIDRYRGSPDVQAMHPAARWGYLSLLASQWQTEDCTLSPDPLDLASASGLGDELWVSHGPRILRKFPPLDIGGRLRNDVCHVEWQEAKKVFERNQMTPEELAELSEKRRKAGILGNEKRWGNRNFATKPSQSDRTCDRQDGKSVANDRLTGTGTTTETKEQKQKTPRAKKPRDGFYEPVKELIFRYYRAKNEVDPEWNGREGKALAMLLAANPNAPLDHWKRCLTNRFHSEVTHGERPGVWIGKLSSFTVPLNQYGKPINGGNNGTRTNEPFKGKTAQHLDAGRRAAEIVRERGEAERAAILARNSGSEAAGEVGSGRLLGDG